MATKNLIMRKSSEKDRGGNPRNGRGPIEPKCPIFTVQYLGKMPARGEYGREFIAEPVETLVKLKDRQKSPKKSALQITEKGFHFLDLNGAFGKEKHVLIPIHHICYGVADEQHPKVFAIITRTDSNPQNSLFECHAFHCERKKEASEITYWLLRTFLEVFEDLQKRRRQRQERKILRQQGAIAGGAGPTFSPSPPTSPTESLTAADMTMYSVILDGSKNKGAAVRLARNPGKNRAVGMAPPAGVPLDAPSGVPLPPAPHVGHVPRDVYPPPGPSKPYPTPPAAHVRGIPDGLDPQGRPMAPDYPLQPDYPIQPDYPMVRHFDPRVAMAPGDVSQYPTRSSKTLSPPPVGPLMKHSDAFKPQSGARYSKNPALPRSRSSTGNTSSTDETNSTFFSDSFSGVSREEADFIFIEMLQEEFGGLDLSPGDGAPGISGRKNTKKTRNGPPDQKLRSEDIEKRVRDWLEYEEGDGAVFASLSSPLSPSPATMRAPAGYNPGYIYQHGGYRGDSRSSRSGGARTIGSQSSVASDKDYF